MPLRIGQCHIIETCWFVFFFEGCTSVVSVGRFFISLYLPLLTVCNYILHTGLGLSVLHVSCAFMLLFLEFIHGIFVLRKYIRKKSLSYLFYLYYTLKQNKTTLFIFDNLLLFWYGIFIYTVKRCHDSFH